MIPDVPQEKLVEAMETFDKDLRDTDQWSDWEQKGAYKYAIVRDGQRYPVKQIIRMATGETNFSGGYEANNYITKRGFSIVSLQDGETEASSLSIHDGLEEILAHYVSARDNEPLKGHPLRLSFNGVSQAIAATNTVSKRPTVTVKPSMGLGNWATIPWIALLDARETDTTQRGVYCVYLFREDMSGVYLTLAQGVTEPREQYGTAKGREYLHDHAKNIRQYCGDLTQHGFALDDNIDLHTGAGLGTDYEASTIAHKFYAAGSVPDEPMLVDDLGTLLSAYDRYLGTKEGKVPPKKSSLGDLVELTNLTQAELEDLESLLRDKKQIIFEGPPGAGKTYVAELFARYFTGNALEGSHDERLEIVQFHQSYGYEDFIQGIRPETSNNGQLEYRVRDGIFKRLCDLAEHNRGKVFVIIIDEINRGNISRILGELLLLLEYRDKQVALPYSSPEDPKFSIPPNIYLLGTMNTTDRSLAQIDYALRRRFYFYRMLPVVDSHAPVLERWLEKQNLPQEDKDRILRLFVNLNRRIQLHLGEHFQVGHSYFMVSDIASQAGRQRVWSRAVLPLLEEYFYNWRDRSKVLSEFEVEQLLSDQQ